jgi:hypothetical protein
MTESIVSVPYFNDGINSIIISYMIDKELKDIFRTCEFSIIKWYCRMLRCDKYMITDDTDKEVGKKSLDVIKWYINEMNLKDNSITSFYNLISVCFTTGVENLKWIFNNTKINEHVLFNKEGLFGLCCEHNNLAAAEYLYTEHDINRDKFITNIQFDYSLRKSSLEIIKWLVEIFYITKEDVVSRDMYKIVLENTLDVVEWFCNKYSIYVKNTGRLAVYYDNIFTIIVCKKSQLNVAKWYYDRILSSSYLSNINYHDFHSSCVNNDPEVPKWIYSLIPDNIRINFDFQVCLSTALLHNNTETVKFLESKYQFAYNNYIANFGYLCKYQDLEYIIQFCEKYQISKSVCLDTDAFMHACYTDNIIVAKWLQQHFDLSKKEGLHRYNTFSNLCDVYKFRSCKWLIDEFEIVKNNDAKFRILKGLLEVSSLLSILWFYEHTCMTYEDYEHFDFSRFADNDKIVPWIKSLNKQNTS